MSLIYQIRDDILWFTSSGAVDYSDSIYVLRCALAEASDLSGQDSAKKWHLLFDVREAVEGRTTSELRDIASLIATNHQILTGRCAIIVSKPSFYG